MSEPDGSSTHAVLPVRTPAPNNLAQARQRVFALGNHRFCRSKLAGEVQSGFVQIHRHNPPRPRAAERLDHKESDHAAAHDNRGESGLQPHATDGLKSNCTGSTLAASA